jgi:hypothetical protein
MDIEVVSISIVGTSPLPVPDLNTWCRNADSGAQLWLWLTSIISNTQYLLCKIDLVSCYLSKQHDNIWSGNFWMPVQESFDSPIEKFRL